MSNIVCNEWKQKVNTSSLSADTYNVALVTSAITLSSDDQVREVTDWSQLSAMEVVGTGYVAGGKALSGVTITKNSTTDRGIFDADDVTWAGTTLTDVRAAIIYKSTGTPVMGKVDFGVNKTTSSAAFIINWNANGILVIN